MGEKRTAHKLLHRMPVLMDSLNQTPLDSSHWPRFLENLVEATDSRSARLLVMDRGAQEVHYSTKVNIDDDQHREYVDYFVNLCPWRPELAQKKKGRLYNTYHDFSCNQAEFHRTEFFNDWARHLDIEHGLCGTVYQDESYTVQLLIQRTRGQGAFPLSLTDQVNGLIPPINSVLRLNRILRVQERQHAGIIDAAERVLLPFLLLDERGQIIHVSQRASALIDGSPLLSVMNNRLCLHHAQLQHELSHRIQITLQKTITRAEPLPVHHSSRLTPIHLFVESIQGPVDATSFWPRDALVAVFIQDPEEQLNIDQGELIRLFGLTSAEARITARLVHGEDAAHIAATAGVSIHTVRTQIKVVLSKTGVNRQTELVSLILRSAATRSNAR